MTTNDATRRPDDIDHLRRREAEERAAAERAACMARTAHEDLADEYAERVAAIERAEARAGIDHARLLGWIDAADRR